MVIDCAVIGAGPAGLAASAALTASGVDHVVLERAEAGHTWRTQRWDSLRLNNPGWMNPMLGEQRNAGTAGAASGLWLIGLRWLTRRSSGNFLTFPTDAATIAHAVTARLAGQTALRPRELSTGARR